MKYLILFFAATIFVLTQSDHSIGGVINFEELSTYSPGSGGAYYNGNSNGLSNSTGWASGGVFFGNAYSSDFGGFWSGWSYSKVANSTTAGFGNQYASAPGGGSNGSGGAVAGQQYAVAFDSGAFFNLPTATRILSIDLTNTTYAALSMRDGDAFAKKFGGTSGNDPDFFRVTFNGFDGLNGTGNLTGSTTISLADFTSPNNAQDFILSSWQTADLASLGNAQSVSLSYASSDVGIFGINTPLFLAVDNILITAVPEPCSLFSICVIGVGWIVRHRQTRRWRVEMHSAS